MHVIRENFIKTNGSSKILFDINVKGVLTISIVLLRRTSDFHLSAFLR